MSNGPMKTVSDPTKSASPFRGVIQPEAVRIKLKGQELTIKKYQYRPLTQPGEIRLLRVLSDGCREARDGSPVPHCEIIHTTSNSKTKYAAVSYFWGAVDNCSPLLVSGMCLYVTHTVSDFLCEGVPQYLWIDQICIDQNDFAERSNQLRLMKTIFKNASCIVVWLGKSDCYTEAAFDLIQNLSRCQEVSDLAERN